MSSYIFQSIIQACNYLLKIQTGQDHFKCTVNKSWNFQQRRLAVKVSKFQKQIILFLILKVLATKGQFISKCLFGVIVCYFGWNDDTKETFRKWLIFKTTEVFRLFFGRIKNNIFCYRNLFTFKGIATLTKIIGTFCAFGFILKKDQNPYLNLFNFTPTLNQ